MLALILRRVLWMIPTLFAISIITFAIIQLPPGDYLTSYIAALQETGETVDEAQVAALRKQYALDRPLHVQYLLWMEGMLLRGDLGMSFEESRPVATLIGERLLLTVIISVVTLLFTWAIAIPIGIYSAVRQYSWGDYAFSFLGFIGLATPGFLLALIFMYIGYTVFGVSAGGLFSPEFQSAPWSLARALDLLKHLWIPVLIVGLEGTAGLIRIMRGNLLDELRKQYVLTARAKGVGRLKLLLKYPVRVAINPIISTIGWLLPAIVSGATITSVVLGLPTTGPRLLQALMNQDMFLAGSMVMMLSFLTVVGTLVSDLLLLWLDPRIRYGTRRE
ncbi:MAG TPA: ABC transporter permease [Planctomycetota bacterium]|nr:ABC transporter permease [Planctomycetota bacterium]HRR83053.1 ABC transporter permease [Planctomycetota bacterium]HRT93094.1 ABC transporter permease [Planctomycetota bacterium]